MPCCFQCAAEVLHLGDGIYNAHAENCFVLGDDIIDCCILSFYRIAVEAVAQCSGDMIICDGAVEVLHCIVISLIQRSHYIVFHLVAPDVQNCGVGSVAGIDAFRILYDTVASFNKVVMRSFDSTVQKVYDIFVFVSQVQEFHGHFPGCHR